MTEAREINELIRIAVVIVAALVAIKENVLKCLLLVVLVEQAGHTLVALVVVAERMVEPVL